MKGSYQVVLVLFLLSLLSVQYGIASRPLIGDCERKIDCSKEKAKVVGEEERAMVLEIPASMDRKEMTITLIMEAKMVNLQLEAMLTVVIPLEHLEAATTVVGNDRLLLEEDQVAKGMAQYVVVVQLQAKTEEAPMELMEENPISPE